MYVPAAFSEERAEVLHTFMSRHGFAAMISNGPDGMEASHLPFLVDGGRGRLGTLRSHMARANRQWESIDGKDVLVVFQGPHAYVSPTWYANQPAVPTWNYAVVHAYGRVRLIEEEAGVKEVLAATVGTYEPAGGWSMAQAPEAWVAGLARAVVAFEVEISRLEGKFKLNQNRSREDQEQVAERLSGGCEIEREVAALMVQRMEP